MECPKLLYNTLKKSSTRVEYLDRVMIIQLSYENYDDPEQGRKDVSADTFVPAADDRKRN